MKPSMLPRPTVSSQSDCCCIAAAVSAGSGPLVPVLR